MGLFGGKKAKEPAYKVAVTPQKPKQKQQDTREYTPLDVVAHRQNGCVPVRGEKYFQARLTALDGNVVEVRIGEIPKDGGFQKDGLGVFALDGTMLGYIPDALVKKCKVKVGIRTAEIARPIYRGEDCVTLFLPKLPKEK